MFSKRLPLSLEPSALAARLNDFRKSGRTLLDLTSSNPTACGLRYPRPEILRAFLNRKVLRYHADPFGAPEVRARIAQIDGVPPHRVLLTASTSEAYSWLFKLLCDPGDEVLIPRPSYPLFEHLTALESVSVRTYPSHYHEGWFIDLDALASSVTSRTRAIVVVNPNNPTGAYLKPHETAFIDELASSMRLAVISDEVFLEFPIAGRPASLAHDPRALTFVLSGLSKYAGLPQMKLGWMVVSGPQELVEDALGRLEVIADTYLSVGAPVQAAVVKLLDLSAKIREQIMMRNGRNLQALVAACVGSPASVLKTEAGWSVVLRIPDTHTEEDWVTLLLELEGVWVQPGFYFDFASGAHFVLSLLTDPNVWDQALPRMISAIRDNA